MIQGASNKQINETTKRTVASFNYLGHLLTADNVMYTPIQDLQNKGRNALRSPCKIGHSKDLTLKLKQRLLK